MNNKTLSNLETIEFRETETEAMLNAKEFREFPEDIRKKLWYYNNGEAFKCIPRNLRLMIENIK